MDCRDAFPDELVERYVRGRLDEAAMESFEEHYFGCRECLARLETLQALPTALSDRAGPALSSGRSFRHRRLPVWLGVAAGLVALAAAWLGLRLGGAKPGERAEAPSTLTVPALVEWARITPPRYEVPSFRGYFPESPEFEVAMDRYRRSDYAGALAGLEQVVRGNPDDAAALFFLGACDLLTDRSSKGMRRLEEVIALGESAYLEEARLYLARALVREGRLDEAASELEKLLALRGDLEDEARQGLQHIRESQPRPE